jgi:uncharacterized protein YegP (UPF0339 family)
MYFTITLDNDGYRARLYAANNRLVWWTEGYTSRSGAEQAIALLRQYGGSAPLR